MTSHAWLHYQGALGNMAGDGVVCCETLQKLGAATQLVGLLASTNLNGGVFRSAAFALSNYVRTGIIGGGMEDQTFALLLQNSMDGIKRWRGKTHVIAEGYWLLHAITGAGAEERTAAATTTLLERLEVGVALAHDLQEAVKSTAAVGGLGMQQTQPHQQPQQEQQQQQHGLAPHLSPMLRLIGNCTCSSWVSTSFFACQ